MARDPSALTSSFSKSLGRLPHRRKPRGKEGRSSGPFWRLQPLRDWLTGLHWSRAALLLGTIAVLSALLSLHLLPDKVALRAGEISPQDVRALRTVRYLDDSATNSLKAAAAARIEPVYSSAHAASEADETITDAYQRLRRD